VAAAATDIWEESAHHQTTASSYLESLEGLAEVNMSETELGVGVKCELGGDLDLPSCLGGLASSLDELVDMLGIGAGGPLEQFQFNELDETLLRHTFDIEDRWPI
jgi:hypothetical protein